MTTYPHSAGWKDTTTSKEAAGRIEASGRALTLRDRVANFFSDGITGTADDVAAWFGESVLAVRPRVSELYKQGILERTGERRQNASGMSCHVYRKART